ncbi:branched-chain amino acid ABC transporter, permease protein [Pseudooceanicola batsensis HTCC2597]|uniref:Branched-chain amino acid ABC transporter, permease protein n=1 Tax=Pseudooceanicola batsensis (strain ATCC BAA-863 / DSM 15984 / KCTC 12145 / HTCC2597) TaxID=252305 RepID=A3U2H0_PSEBH|nr:urea ABC transporter permease subunit UrtB [Pseudooceanicola batsensis]EAQ01770.1 branched-chain amino acid ABC transporter, permease protein [Pseudooceanicola batsensis HTCC2597]
MFLRLIAAAALSLLAAGPGSAQDADAPIQQLLQQHSGIIQDSSRRTIQPAIDAIRDSGLPRAQLVLEKWAAREMWLDEETGLFVHAEEIDRDTLRIFDFATGEEIGEVPDDTYDQLKPNSGIRGLINSALVRFQLSDPDPANRLSALQSLERNGNESHLSVLRDSIDGEPDPAIRARKERIERLLTISFGATADERIAAMEAFRGDLGVDVRAKLNPILTTRTSAGAALPEGVNLARELTPGTDITESEAYELLVSEGLAPARLTPDAQRRTLQDNIVGGMVGGVAVPDLRSPAARDRAYAALVGAGRAEPAATNAEAARAIEDHVFYETYVETDAAVTGAAEDVLTSIEMTVAMNQFLDLSLDALSLASIYFLAAIGLAITFGVMGVINMAHGEFIMMGAYTGYVIQQIIPNYTVSILVAIPVAFAVTFGAGVAMERLVIRWLYSRPLETLLATFGISIALQQIAKNVFGTQARPLTSPGWLDGAWIMNDVVSISYIRIAIFVLALVFLAVFLFIMKKTRLGLETRAVTQNPRMAASMGINPDRVNMLTFGLGSGIAGIAGVAIGLYAKVTSELGSDYIVQSFMTVVVGGVGNIWGTLLGATMIGFLQKGIEWLNPSNTLAAQTYMIVFIIIFIQFRPRGIIALRGRAAGD